MSRTWNWGWNSSHASHRALCCDLYFLVCVTLVSTTQDGIPESTGDGGPRQFISHFPSSGLLYGGRRGACAEYAGQPRDRSSPSTFFHSAL